jgi:hypothetical protein
MRQKGKFITYSVLHSSLDCDVSKHLCRATGEVVVRTIQVARQAHNSAPAFQSSLSGIFTQILIVKFCQIFAIKMKFLLYIFL